MKRILFIVILFLSVMVNVTGQTEGIAGKWQVYPSYQIATQNVVVGNVVYSLMNGNLLRYDAEDESVKLYNSLYDLNDVHISHIAYSKEAKRLIVVYDNQNIDLLDADDRVFNIASLKDKALAGKNVNSITIQGSLAYLTTGFGFVVIDMKQGVVIDTHRLGIDVRSLAVCGEDLWVCGMDGVYMTSLTNTEMHNLSSWKKRHSATNWLQMVVFEGEVYIRHKSGIYHFTPTTSPLFRSGTYDLLKVLSDGKMYFTDSDHLYICTSEQDVQTVALSSSWNDLSVGSKGVFWVSEGDNGLQTYKLTDNTLVKGTTEIQPNSPRRDLFYHMNYVSMENGEYRLLVAGGINTFLDVRNPATAMILEDGRWSYLDEKTPAKQYPELWHRNTTDLVQDPSNPNHFFASPYRTGLYEYKDGKMMTIYNCDNSPLRSILPRDSQYKNYVSATCLAFDDDANLWMCNQETDTIIRVRTADGKWRALYYAEIAGQPQCDGYLFSSSGINFLTCRRMDARGFFGFTTNGTLSNVRDDKHMLRTNIVNQDGTSYSPNNFNCMTEDMDGRIWCGTDRGLFVIDNPSMFFDSDFRFTQVKIARNDGSGLADYLLNGVDVKCIAVDGGNRKWIGTENNGIYLVSADGTELIHHFMASETPLLSDNVQCIAVHPRSGEVMIGTDKGLCSFMSDATEAESQLEEDKVVAYPNPVTPDYNGPIRIDGLTFNAEVKVCSTTGQLVWSGRSNGGTCTWNGCNMQGKRVSSGVYHVVANTEDGSTAVVCRIIVIK